MMRRIKKMVLAVFSLLTLGSAAWSQAPLSLIPINPCRVVDTRMPVGPLGGPSIAAGTSRSFNPQLSTSCSIPSTAEAYSFNVTVVPAGNYLGYLTVYPTGATRPVVSTMNSFDGRTKANAVIVGGGTAGAVSFYATDTTDVVVDITGYFVPPSVAGGLDFYPMPNGPCNLVDTTQPIPNPDTHLAGPSLKGFTARSFPVSTSLCLAGLLAEAYSLNITSIPHTTLGYLTVWNSDFSQPVVSTLNAPTGTVTSNAALIVTASGDLSALPSDDSDLIIDINGYFGNPGTIGFRGASLYTMTPCRALDTRTVNNGNPVQGLLFVDMGTCFSSTPFGYVTNATVVPTTTFAYLQVYDDFTGQPTTDTLHALDAAVTSNMAIATDQFGDLGVSTYSASPTALIVDVTGYFDSANLRITTTSLANAYVGIKYAAQLTAQGGTPPYTWSATGLPTGLTIGAKTGLISGTTTVQGVATVIVTVTPATGGAVSATFTLNVQALVPLQITTTTFPDAQIGVSYTFSVFATGGITPYTWSISSGGLPAGLTLSTDTSAPYEAQITGVPTGPTGTSNFSLQVTDSQTIPATATAPFSIKVSH